MQERAKTFALCQNVSHIERMKKKSFTVRLDHHDVDSLGKVADTYGMEPTQYAAAVLTRFADLKPEFALHALTAIPKEYFRPGPGRPPASATRSDVDVPKLT